MAATPKEDGRDIAATLRDLHIDQDADPADAAQDAAAEVASSTEVEEEEEAEDPTAAAPTNGAPASSAVAEVVVPKPKAPDAPLPGIIPAPKPAKAKARTGASAKGLPKALTDKAPGAAKVKVYKREKGKVWFIEEYTLDDLASFSDFESFLRRYVMDDHGAGEYELIGVDQAQREIPLGTVRLKGLPARGEKNEMLDLVKAVLARSEEDKKEFLERMQAAMTPQTAANPMEMLQGVLAVQEQLDGKAGVKAAEAKKEANDAMSALAASGDRTMQMMMAFMQANQAQQQQQMQMMMALMAKPKEEDPLMKVLVAKLMKDEEEGGSRGGALPMPTPPPAMDLPALITALATFAQSMGGGGGEGGGDDEFKEFLKAMLLKQDSGNLSVKETIELLTSRNDNKAGLRGAIDDLAAVLNVANSINRGQEPASAGPFDALAALFSNRDFVGSIANTIRAKIGRGEAIQRTQLEAERQRLALQHRVTQRTMQMQGHPPPPPQQVPGGQPYVVPQPGQYAPPGPPNAGAPPVQHVQQPVQQVVQPIVQPSGLTPERVQEATERTVQRMGKIPELPALTLDHVQHIAAAAAAGDEGEVVGKTVAMLIYFAEFEDWRMFSEDLLTFVRDGRRRETRDYLTAFFDGLAEINLIEESLAKLVVNLVVKHFAVVQQQMADLMVERDENLTGDDLLSGEDTGETDEETPSVSVEPTGDDGGHDEAS